MVKMRLTLVTGKSMKMSGLLQELPLRKEVGKTAECWIELLARGQAVVVNYTCILLMSNVVEFAQEHNVEEHEYCYQYQIEVYHG